MTLSISTIVGSLLAVYFLYRCFWFWKYYTYARQTGYPIWISPVPSKSALWLVLAPILEPYFRKYLPAWMYDRIDITIHNWPFRRGRWYNDRLGNIFTLVTWDECALWCADPVVGQAILQRRNDFQQAPIVSKILGFLGPNLFGVNGDDWKRHRRMFAANLDERISKTVWIESCRQAQAMVDYMIHHPGGETLDGLHSVAINVIGKAGYNQHQEWSPMVANVTPEEDSGRAAYFAMLSLVTTKLHEAAFIPPKILQLPFMPSSSQSLGRRLERAPQSVQEVLAEEKEAVANTTAPRNNFLSLLLKLSEEEKQSGGDGFSLTNEEISGNLFVFSAAGFETTANTMGFAVTLLAVHPELQDWIREELQSLDSDPTAWPYETVFSKCKRTLALMLETLRLYTPVSNVTRAVLKTTQLADSHGTHQLNAPMNVYVESSRLHEDPAIWGQDVLEFKPSRWLDEAGQLVSPPKGAYLPWSGGPRICPGWKMAQVEFVATFATLLRSARCEPLPTKGLEKPEDLRQRLQDILANSISALTLTVPDKKAIQLRWIPIE